jgi:hypothetical protein
LQNVKFIFRDVDNNVKGMVPVILFNRFYSTGICCLNLYHNGIGEEESPIFVSILSFFNSAFPVFWNLLYTVRAEHFRYIDLW